MENIVFAVVPVRECSMIGASLLDGLGRTDDFLVFRGNWLALISSEPLLVRRLEVHSVRVNDLRLLLHVECFFVVLYLCLGQLVVIILLVVRE